MLCPKCNQIIEKVRTEYGIVAMCQTCFGHFLLEKRILESIPKEKWNKVLDFRKNPSEKIRMSCPSCKSLMDTHDLPEEYNSIQIDRCSKCKVIWFEKDKIEDLHLRQNISNTQPKNEDAVARALLLNIKLDQKKKELERKKYSNSYNNNDYDDYIDEIFEIDDLPEV